MEASASGSSRTVNVTDANEEPRWLAVVALISSFVAVQWREEGQVNVGGGTGCKSLFLPPPHTRARAPALAVTQHVSLLIRLCHIAIPRRWPSMFLRALQHFPRGPFNHVYWRINLCFPSDGRPLIVCRRRSPGERCTLGKKKKTSV